MHQLITMELSATISEQQLTLDELAIKVRQLFAQHGMAQLLSLLLQLLDELLSLRHTTGSATPPRLCPCGQCRYECHDRQQRTVRTSVGELNFKWRRLRCRACQRTWCPLRQFLGLEPWQRKTNELERIAVEVISEQSYRRGSRHLHLAGEIPIPKSTLHRWVVQSPVAEWTPATDQPWLSLMADGTGYRRRPDPQSGQDHRGDLRVLVGQTTTGQWVACGAWSGKTWAEIVAGLVDAQGQPCVQAATLVSDSENGLPQALAKLVAGQQRCPWHLVRDLSIALWKDGASLEQRRQQQYHVANLVGIELPPESLEQVKAEDKSALRQRVATAQQQLDELVQSLRTRGYSRAANYIAEAQDKLFRYVDFWLETGLVCPRTTGWLERVMRELGRRLKRMAFGWSERGAARMACVILRRITDPKEWEGYWQQRLGLNNNVLLKLRSVKVA